jgi:hypothetical protein
MKQAPSVSTVVRHELVLTNLASRCSTYVMVWC